MVMTLMATETKCLTPGCVFHTHIQPKSWSVCVDFQLPIALDEEESILVEKLLHNQVELVLSKYFKERDG